MKNFIPTKHANSCEICGDKTGKCRRKESLRLCMTHVDAVDVPGFKYVGLSKGGQWGKWIEDSAQVWTEEQQEQRRRDRDLRRKQQADEESRRRSEALPAVERDRLYHNLLNQLSLHPEDKADLQRRGMTNEQIETADFKSVEQWQKLELEVNNRLPGVSLDGLSLNTQPGYLCPIRNIDRLIVGCQVRKRSADSGNRYTWLSSKTEKRLDGPSPHLPNGELPLAVHQPSAVKIASIGMTEGTGPKPFITSQRLGQVVIGAAGGQFASSPQTLRETLEKLDAKIIDFYPDAGAVANSNVIRQYRATWELLQNWGYPIRVAWWNQASKNDPDIDELETLHLIQFITLEQFFSLCDPQQQEQRETDSTDTDNQCKESLKRHSTPKSDHDNAKEQNQKPNIEVVSLRDRVIEIRKRNLSPSQQNEAFIELDHATKCGLRALEEMTVLIEKEQQEPLADNPNRPKNLSSPTGESPSFFEGIMERVRRILEIEDEALQKWELGLLAKSVKAFTASQLLAIYQVKEQSAKQFCPIDVHDFLAQGATEREWVIAAHISKSTTLVLFADGGVGKTLLAYDLAKAIATGKPWNGFPTRQGKVLIVQTDEPEIDTRERLDIANFTEIPKGVVQIEMNWQFSQIRKLREWIERERPAFVIIDSFTSANRAAAEQEKDASYASCLYELRDVANQYGCAIMVLHHENKGGGARGTTAIRNNVSEVWQLRKGKPQDGLTFTQRILEIEKSRSGCSGTFKIELNVEDYSWNHQGDFGIDESPAGLPLSAQLLNYLAAHKGIRFEAAELTHEFTASNKEAIRKQLERLRKKGLIEAENRVKDREGTGAVRHKVYFAPDFGSDQNNNSNQDSQNSGHGGNSVQVSPENAETFSQSNQDNQDTKSGQPGQVSSVEHLEPVETDLNQDNKEDVLVLSRFGVQVVQVPSDKSLGDFDPNPDKKNEDSSFSTPRKLSYQLVSDAKALVDALKVLENAKVLGIDTETTGLCPHRHEIRLVQLAAPNLPVIVVDLVNIPKADREPLQRLLEGPAIKVGQNWKFDLKFLTKAGLKPKGPYFDTMLASQLLASGTPDKHSLQTITAEHLQIELNKEQQVSDWTGKISPAQFEYAARDAAILLQLRDVMKPKIVAAGLVKAAELEFNALPAVAEMELNGMLLDIAEWKKLSLEIEQSASKAKAELNKQLSFGNSKKDLNAEVDHINLNSNKQILTAFKALGIPIESTSKDALIPLSSKYPAVKALLEYRHFTKSLSSFIYKFPTHINPVTGRIHPDYNQYGAATGRFSQSHPNLQQVPRSENVRSCFIPAPGYKLCIADYSQIELRVVAEISGDPTMISAYQKGEDLHKLTASLITGKPLDEVSKAERQAAKPVNFGLIYGCGAEKLKQTAENDYGVTKSLKEWEAYRTKFFKAYRGISNWHSRLKKEKPMEIRTLSGRRRRWTEKPWVTGTSNSIVQGTAADIAKRALALLPTALEGTGAKLIGMVHDEILLEAPETIADEAARILKETMEVAGRDYLKRVPIEADVKVVDSWSEK